MIKNSKKRQKDKSFLTDRERDILKWVQEGKTNQEIGQIIEKTKWTVKFHLKNIMKKLDAVNRAQVISKAIGEGLLPASRSFMTDEPYARLKVCIVGCGKGGTSLINILKQDPSVEITGVADINPSAPGMKLAHSLHIPVTINYEEIIKKGVALIINVTGSREIGNDIRQIKPRDAEQIEGTAAKLLYQFAEERRRRGKETERMLKEQEALYHLGLVIENIDSIKDAGYAIVDYATRLTATPAGSLVIFDERREDMVLVATKGFSKEFKTVERWKMCQGGLTSHILNQKAPVIISDFVNSPIVNPLLAREGIKALMAAPLTLEGRIIGILYVNDFKKRNFRAEDVSLFSLLAVYAAMTIERVKSIEEMRIFSITDGLTGLYNHRHLMEQMHKELLRADRHGHPLSVIMLDVDHFKDYNDKFGHLEGNKVLRGVAKVLSGTTRLTDTVGRFGGEEFCVVLPEIKKDGAAILARRFLKEVSDNLSSYRRITLSGGIATFPSDGNTPLALLKKADSLLYKAKQRGRNKVCS